MNLYKIAVRVHDVMQRVMRNEFELVRFTETIEDLVTCAVDEIVFVIDRKFDIYSERYIVCLTINDDEDDSEVYYANEVFSDEIVKQIEKKLKYIV